MQIKGENVHLGQSGDYACIGTSSGATTQEMRHLTGSLLTGPGKD